MASVSISCPSCSATDGVVRNLKPAGTVYYVHQVKLTDKPLSFGYSVVDSHSSFCPSKSKNPPKRVFT
ncbi:hypothetical protein FHB04_03590 [Escherichia coli]|nr:hypothetical protein [Escherichia coli]